MIPGGRGMPGVTHTLVPGEDGKVWLIGPQVPCGPDSHAAWGERFPWLALPIHSLGSIFFYYAFWSPPIQILLVVPLTLNIVPLAWNVQPLPRLPEKLFLLENELNITFCRKPSCLCCRDTVALCVSWSIYMSTILRRTRECDCTWCSSRLEASRGQGQPWSQHSGNEIHDLTVGPGIGDF